MFEGQGNHIYLRLLSIYLTASSFLVEHLMDDIIVGIDTRAPIEALTVFTVQEVVI